MPNEDLFAKFFGGLAAAITDVREKVVEEPTYGRALSSPEDAPLWSQERDKQQSIERFYSVDRDKELER